MPRRLVYFVALAVIAFGVAISAGWIKDPTVTPSAATATQPVSVADVAAYRRVEFRWRGGPNEAQGGGTGVVHLRVVERPRVAEICAFFRTADGLSARAGRWLATATMKVGSASLPASFVVVSDRPPGDGLRAGCVRIDGVDGLANAPATIDGPPLQEGR